MDTYKPGPTAWPWGAGVCAVFLVGALIFVLRDGWTGSRILGVLLMAAWGVFCLIGLRKARQMRQQEQRERTVRNTLSDRTEGDA